MPVTHEHSPNEIRGLKAFVLALLGAGVALHAPNHQSGGIDPIKLDDLAAPDNNTDLNATAAAHGLLPRLSGVATDSLKGDGTWGSASSSLLRPMMLMGG